MHCEQNKKKQNVEARYGLKEKTMTYIRGMDDEEFAEAYAYMGDAFFKTKDIEDIMDEGLRALVEKFEASQQDLFCYLMEIGIEEE